MPRKWLYIQLADRWHVPPWTLRDAPIDALQETLGLLGVEGRVSEDWAGLGSGDSLSREFEDDDDW